MMSLLGFLLAITVLVAVHELGHYGVARMCRVRVLRFSIGFGPVLSGFKDRHGTEWVLSIIPLGGYVRMLDERESPVVPTEREYAFNTQSLWKRNLIVAAGPLANLVLAVLLLFLIFLQPQDALRPVLDSPSDGTPFHSIGVKKGDVIFSINNQDVQTWGEFAQTLVTSALSDEYVDLGINCSDQHCQKRINFGAVDIRHPESILQSLGALPLVPFIPPRIGSVKPGSPAQQSGLLPGDLVLSVNGYAIEDWKGLSQEIATHAGASLALDIERAGRRHAISVIPISATTVSGEKRGVIGIAAPPVEFPPQYRITVHMTALEALAKSVGEVWYQTVMTLKMIGKMVVGQVSSSSLSGPLGIAGFAGQSLELGLNSFLRFLSVMSISLGVLNLLPLPMLDGGHLLYHAMEAIKGAPLSARFLEVTQMVGMVLLISLMLFAIFNDLSRLLG